MMPPGGEHMKPEKPSAKLFTYSRWKLLVLAGAAATVLAALAPRLTHITSVDGVVDTNLVTVRSAISGFVTVPGAVYPGAILKRGNLIYEVRNSRYGDADSVAQFYALKNHLHLVTGECEVLKVELAQLARDRDRTRRLIKAHSAPTISLERIQSDYERVENLLHVKRRQKDDVQEDLKEIREQMELFKREDGKAPFDAVVWAVLARSNEFQAGASPLLELIDKRDVWVNAYFSEQSAAQLTPGRRVSIEIISTGKTTSGHVRFVRAGVGRITINSPVQKPPEDFKERMVVARINFDPTESFTPEEFLGIGRSVRVSIER